MQVVLLYNTPLWVASTAIRKCWASEDKSDTKFVNRGWDSYEDEPYCEEVAKGEHNLVVYGDKDKALIERVGNKNKHSSTLEHLNYSFDIDGISRACLQELARHRHASMSVKSTRYTLKELKNATNDLKVFLVDSNNVGVNNFNIQQLRAVQKALTEGASNDLIKYALPEAYKTSLVWTINARSLQNFLSLRTDKAALREIRELAHKIFEELPEEHKYLFKEFVKERV